MPDNLLIPSVDLRIGALEEYNRQQKEKAALQHRKPKPRPCLTISREFGCEGYRVAELLRDLMMRKSGDEWVLIDRAILEEVARHHSISEDILRGLGEKNRLLDEILATFSPRWKSDHEYFQLLCSHVVSLAEQGNVIILELGGAIITRHIEHSHHFRLFAPQEYKVASIARRLGLDRNEAGAMVEKQQHLRDKFTRDFLGRDDHDPTFYDILFNNQCHSAERIAHIISDTVRLE